MTGGVVLTPSIEMFIVFCGNPAIVEERGLGGIAPPAGGAIPPTTPCAAAAPAPAAGGGVGGVGGCVAGGPAGGGSVAGSGTKVNAFRSERGRLVVRVGVVTAAGGGGAITGAGRREAGRRSPASGSALADLVGADEGAAAARWAAAPRSGPLFATLAAVPVDAGDVTTGAASGTLGVANGCARAIVGTAGAGGCVRGHTLQATIAAAAVTSGTSHCTSRRDQNGAGAGVAGIVRAKTASMA